MKQSSKENEAKIKEEAKRLIEKTKLMISNLDTTESSNAYNKRDLSPQLDSLQCSLSQRSNIVSLDKHLLNTSLIDAKTDMKLTIKHLSEKIAELSNVNKCLEKEIKDKDKQLAQYTKRLNAKNDEVNRLNQVIINERSDNASIENLKLKRRIASLEQTIEENKVMYEQIIKEYQDKLTKVADSHSQNITQLNRIQESNSKLNDAHEAIKSQCNDLNEKMSIANIKCEQFENKNNFNERLIERTQDNMKVVIMMIKELARIESISYGNNKRIITKLKDIADSN